MMSHIAQFPARIPDRPCDTEPAEMGMRVPTLRAERGSWLGRLLTPFRRKPPTTYHKCLAVHMHFAKHTGALK